MSEENTLWQLWEDTAPELRKRVFDNSFEKFKKEIGKLRQAPQMIKMKLDFSTWITIYEDLWEKYLEMSDEDQKIMEEVVTKIFARGFDKVEMDKISEEFEK